MAQKFVLKMGNKVLTSEPKKEEQKPVEQPVKKPFTLAGLTSKPKPKPVEIKPQASNPFRGLGITKKLAQQDQAEKRRVEAREIKMGNEKAALQVLMRKKVEEDLQRDIASISIQRPDEIELDPSQKAALDGMIEERFACLIGAAGTGKTTVTKRLVKMLEAVVPTINLKDAWPKTIENEKKADQYNVAICFCAFTGRAVQMMKRALPKEYHPMANTIHSTLGYMPDYEPYIKENGDVGSKLVFRPTFTASNKLPYKVYIIDEAGMVPIALWNELFAAIPEGSRIYMIGDINQLPPVQGRSALGFAMTKWPVFELTKIHRQAEGNPIITNAHKILQGMFPAKAPSKFDIMSMPGGSIQTKNAVLAVIKKLHQHGQFDPMRDALIVPQNKSEIGQTELNEKLVLYFNPPKEENGVVLNRRTMITAGYVHMAFAVGDKVMILQNDRENGLTNGMTGIVTSINLNGDFKGNPKSGQDATFGDGPSDAEDFDLASLTDSMLEEEKVDEKESQRAASHIMTVMFGEGDAGTEISFATAGQYKKIAHAYAFTCHKSQGGEYPTVVILCHSANGRMLSREWLYTAVTRAQERVILLCNDRGLTNALNNQRIKGKNLQQKIEAFNALQDRSDVTVPNLPERMKA